LEIHNGIDSMLLHNSDEFLLFLDAVHYTVWVWVTVGRWSATSWRLAPSEGFHQGCSWYQHLS